MLDTKERYILQNFPLLIDPVAASLEVQATRTRTAPDGRPERLEKPTWRQLQRVTVRHDTFPFAMDSRMVHFFGLANRPEESPFLLAYDATGTLRFRIDKEEGEFVPYLVPEELNGKPVVKPSVRITFDHPEDAQHYLSLVETIRAGGSLHPEGCEFLHRVIQRSAEARFTTVAKKP